VAALGSESDVGSLCRCGGEVAQQQQMYTGLNAKLAKLPTDCLAMAAASSLAGACGHLEGGRGVEPNVRSLCR
jgi:hypothetical protein